MLVVENVSKTYPGGVQALQGVSIEISPGVFGLLGPNGAGKTTLMRIIATLLDPDEGRVLFDGWNVHEHRQELRRRLGYLPQDFGLYDHMPAETFLRHYAELKGYSGRERDEAVRNLLQLVRLWEVRKRKLGSFSGGMRRRFGIAMALLGNPDLLIVDEPTAGLDPEERRRFLRILAEIAEQRVVLLSTHIVADVEEMCQEVAILHQGRVVVRGKPEALIRPLAGKVYATWVRREDIPALAETHRLLNLRIHRGDMEALIFSEIPPGEAFRPVEPTLEEAYFFYTGFSYT